MKWIKSDLKRCPVCGKSIKWRTLNKKQFPSRNPAANLTRQLNEQKAKQESLSLKEIKNTKN